MDIYLHCQDPQNNTDKVYSLHLRPTTAGKWAVLGWNGRWGSTMIPQFKVYSTEKEANNDFKKRLAEKLKKGYGTVRSGAVWPNGNVLLQQNIVDHTFVDKIYNKVLQTNWPSGSATPTIPVPQAHGKTTAHTTAKGVQPQAKTKAKTNLPAIPPWILSCFYEIPEKTYDRAVLILQDTFPNEKDLIQIGSEHASQNNVDWMRAIFARLPINARKGVYRRFSIVLHPDQGGDDAIMARWNESYQRFSI